MTTRVRPLLVLATLGLAGLALAGHAAAPRPRAQACGACLCADDQRPFLVYPGGATQQAALNARVFVLGPGVSTDTVALIERDAPGPPEPLAATVELAGTSSADGVWIVPDEMLRPETLYDVRVAGEAEPVATVETASHVDDEPPAVATVAVDEEGGSLRGVCDEKTGVALELTTAEEEHFRSLVQIDVRSAAGDQARLFLDDGLAVAFGRWDGDEATWGRHCLGRANVDWLEAGVPVDVQVVLFDTAGNASAPAALGDVAPRAVAAPGCPDADESPAGCTAAR